MATFQDVPKYKTQVMMSTYLVPLRPETSDFSLVDATITVPRDLTPAEAERLAGVLKSVAVNWNEVPADQVARCVHGVQALQRCFQCSP